MDNRKWIRQTGMDNRKWIRQTGAVNRKLIRQTGMDNRKWVRQTGAANRKWIRRLAWFRKWIRDLLAQNLHGSAVNVVLGEGGKSLQGRSFLGVAQS
jgi:hypothetical protein